MKKNLMILAAAAACAGLLSLTGCEKNGNENQTEETEVQASIQKQWVASAALSDGLGGTEDGRVIYDIDLENSTVTYGAMSPSNKTMLDMYIEAFGLDITYDENTDFMFSDEIEVSETKETDSTSGTITGTGQFGTYTITYSGLTENSVKLQVSVQDPFSDSPVVNEYECTAAEGAQIINPFALVEM